MNIYESSEDYLETILMLSESSEQVRSIDIVNKLGYSKPSVSVAMKKLRENGLIHVDGDGFIHLLPEGRSIAERIYERHQLIAEFLRRIGVDPSVAAQEACKIEHDISQDTFRKLIAHAESLK